MKIIHTIDGYEVMVDDEDFTFINDCYDLYKAEDGYIICRLKPQYRQKRMGLYSSISIHKILMLPDKMGRSINIDHKDGNVLNNQKGNLRICSHSENMKNRKPNNTYKKLEPASIYKGVTWHKKREIWESKLAVNGEHLFLGSFSNEMAAANCYNYHAEIHHKEFAKFNEVPFMSKEEWMKFKIEKSVSSKYRGVSFDKTHGKWTMQIWDNNIKKNILKRFKTEKEAALAYNDESVRIKGNKAKLNDVS